MKKTIKCRLCGEKIAKCTLDLGMTPIANRMIEESQLEGEEKYYPLRICRCSSCGLVQLMDDVNPKDIFTEYPYYSSFSKGWLNHAKDYSEKMQKVIPENATVIEIACNDGYLLQNFTDKQYTVYGIEPSENVAQVSVKKGINTIIDFFTTKLAKQMVLENKVADLIIANNVVIEVPDINDFMQGVSLVLKDSGIATFEFQYVKNIIDLVQFDTIFHEHYSFFSLTVFEALLNKHGLCTYDVELLPSHGGSLRVFAKHKNNNLLEKQIIVDEMLEEEIRRGINSEEYYENFSDKVQMFKKDFCQCIEEIQRKGKKIAGFGAAAKGNTLLNYCGIGRGDIDFVIDEIRFKQGKYLPGTKIPVYPLSELKKRKPDYLVVLPWNFEKEIVEKTSFIYEWGAKHIIPKNIIKIISNGQTIEYNR